jgi:hypothetical protein
LGIEQGPHRWLAAIFVPMFLHAPMQLGKVFTFCKVTSITKKIVIKTRTKPNIMNKIFFKRKKTSVPQKIQQTNKRKQVFHKNTSKQKTDLKNQQKKRKKKKEKRKKKKTFYFLLARRKVSKLRISKRITFLCK